MKIFLRTSSRPGGFNQTDIEYKIEDGRSVKIEEDLTETLALLRFATLAAVNLKTGSLMEVYSAPNALTNPFIEKWIEDWRRDGFFHARENTEKSGSNSTDCFRAVEFNWCHIL
ncbi:hypothetical protein [Pseudolabrys sp. FHR47]|uniref:hypothetical protein n=1 Tax=Pseudolabrys sp. FHR47 TaxID=2562284 RepID=UPI0010BEC2F9|nr:hypothetical protein [Pseudolabrys sp. FHR47]